jgi:hypothetical protein
MEQRHAIIVVPICAQDYQNLTEQPTDPGIIYMCPGLSKSHRATDRSGDHIFEQHDHPGIISLIATIQPARQMEPSLRRYVAMVLPQHLTVKLFLKWAQRPQAVRRTRWIRTLTLHQLRVCVVTWFLLCGSAPELEVRAGREVIHQVGAQHLSLHANVY